MYRTPKTASALKDNTLSVRLAGADAPEAAHFGHEAQPFSKEAKDRLKQLVEGRTVWVEVSVKWKLDLGLYAYNLSDLEEAKKQIRPARSRTSISQS